MIEHITGADLPRRMERHKVPAVSIAATADGQSIETAVFGAINDQTMFQAASISKPVFAVAVMRLHEQGRIDIGAPVAELSYHWKKYGVTLAQLLSHTAGTNVHGFSGYDGYGAGKPLPTVAQILSGSPPTNSPKVKLKRKPGTRFDYSGGGYILAQQVVTDALGVDFHALLRDLVLEPFGMCNSTFEQELPLDVNYAPGYTALGQIKGNYMRMPELSAAGLWTTPSDLVCLGLELQRALRGESNLLRKDTLEMMLTRQPEKKPGKERYGLGLGLFSDDIFGHSGGNVGYRSCWRVSRRSGAAAAFMINTDGPGASAIFDELVPEINKLL